MAQIQPMYLQPVLELRVVCFKRVASRGIRCKACRDTHVGAGTQQFERCLKADFHPCPGDQGVTSGQIRALLTFGIVVVAAFLAHGIVVAVGEGEGLLADITVQGSAQRRRRRRVSGLRRRQPQRCVAGGTALGPQASALDDLRITLAGGRPIRPPERLGHFHQVVPFRLRDEAGQGEQLPALLLGQLRQLRTVRFNGAQHLDAGAYGVSGQCLRVSRIGGVHHPIV
jgi:hypothetical protein